MLLIDARSFCLYVKGLFGMFAYRYAPKGEQTRRHLSRLQGLSYPHQAASYFFLKIEKVQTQSSNIIIIINTPKYKHSLNINMIYQ